MVTKKDRWWRVVPWGWVLVTAYVTALLCVAFSQVLEPGGAMLIVRDYQTLIAGLATIAALFIAVQQLKRQANRDTVDAHRHHQVEMDALGVLGREAQRLSRSSSYASSQYGDTVHFDKSRWERLRNEVHVSLAPTISKLIDALEVHNRLLDDPHAPFLTFNRVDERQLGEARFTVLNACQSLAVAVAERKNTVRRMIEATS